MIIQLISPKTHLKPSVHDLLIMKASLQFSRNCKVFVSHHLVEYVDERQGQYGENYKSKDSENLDILG